MKAPLAGIVAGFAATVVLSLLMIIKAAAGMLPALDVIAMLAGMAGAPTVVGWIMHFIIGAVVYGVIFSVLYVKLPGGSAVAKGIAFSVLAWLVMMIAVMPMAGAGFFGLNIGVAAPVATLVLHVIYGAVLGLVYIKLVDNVQVSHPAATPRPGPG